MDDALSTTPSPDVLVELLRQVAELTRRVALTEARLDAIHGATARVDDVYLRVVSESEEAGRGPR